MQTDMIRRILFYVVAAVGFLCGSTNLNAQKASLSTDLLGYANFVTMNLDASYPVSRHWSINAGWWPWNVYSGWWLGGKMQYQEYNTGGIFSRKTREGDRYGAGVAGGYSYMLGRHLNLDFGIGLWGGMDKYSVYECPVCGVTSSSGAKFFILPSDIMVALSYVF